MGYQRKEIRAGKIIIVRKSHTAKYPPPPGRPRGKKENESPKAVKRNNARNAKNHLIGLVNENFTIGDLWIDLHYGKEERPTTQEEAEKHLTKFIRILREEWRKAGGELKYIAVTEKGKRGNFHHHILLNAGFVSAERVLMLWGMRYGNSKLVYSDDLTELAEYIFKQGKPEIREENDREGKRSWRASKNLRKPEIKKETIPAGTWKNTPTPPRGYTVVEDSIATGFDAMGYPWMEYRLCRIPEPAKKTRRRE
jgi:hypothetical protein